MDPVSATILAVGLFLAAVALALAVVLGGRTPPVAPRDAAADYAYEARKELLHGARPAFVGLARRAGDGLGVVWALAEAAADGRLRETGDGPLKQDGPFLRSVVWGLLAPQAAAVLLQRRLELLDPGTDARWRSLEPLVDALFRVFRDDRALAAAAPRLDYQPDHPNGRFLRQGEPQTYLPQGLGLVDVKAAASALIAAEGGVPRVISLDELEHAWGAEEGDALRAALRPVVTWVQGFHPHTRPVAWRILVTWCHLLQALRDQVDEEEPLRVAPIPGADRAPYAWRRLPGGRPDLQVSQDAFGASATWLRDVLGDQFKRGAEREGP